MVGLAWDEARRAHAAAAYTAAEIMCRKILMHIAVDKADAEPNKRSRTTSTGWTARCTSPPA